MSSSLLVQPNLTQNPSIYSAPPSPTKLSSSPPSESEELLQKVKDIWEQKTEIDRLRKELKKREDKFKAEWEEIKQRVETPSDNSFDTCSTDSRRSDLSDSVETLEDSGNESFANDNLIVEPSQSIEIKAFPPPQVEVLPSQVLLTKDNEIRYPGGMKHFTTHYTFTELEKMKEATDALRRKELNDLKIRLSKETLDKTSLKRIEELNLYFQNRNDNLCLDRS